MLTIVSLAAFVVGWRAGKLIWENASVYTAVRLGRVRWTD